MSKLKINLEELTKDIDKVFNILDAVDLDDLDSKKIKNITKEKFLEMESHLNGINLTKVVEMSDETKLQDQAACAGGNCEIV